MKHPRLRAGTSAQVLTLTVLVVGGAVAGLASFNFFSAIGSSAHNQAGAQVQGAQSLGSTNGAGTPASGGSGVATQAMGCRQVASSDPASETPEFSCAYVISASRSQAVGAAAPAALGIASGPSNSIPAYVCTPLAMSSDGEGGLGIGANCTAAGNSDANWAS